MRRVRVVVRGDVPALVVKEGLICSFNPSVGVGLKKAASAYSGRYYWLVAEVCGESRTGQPLVRCRGSLITWSYFHYRLYRYRVICLWQVFRNDSNVGLTVLPVQSGRDGGPIQNPSNNVEFRVLQKHVQF